MVRIGEDENSSVCVLTAWLVTRKGKNQNIQAFRDRCVTPLPSLQGEVRARRKRRLSRANGGIHTWLGSHSVVAVVEHAARSERASGRVRGGQKAHAAYPCTFARHRQTDRRTRRWRVHSLCTVQMSRGGKCYVQGRKHGCPWHRTVAANNVILVKFRAQAARRFIRWCFVCKTEMVSRAALSSKTCEALDRPKAPPPISRLCCTLFSREH